MDFKMSTFAESSAQAAAAPVQTVENTAPETTVTTPENVAAPDTSSTTVNNEGALETTAQSPETTATEQTSEEANFFDLKMPSFDNNGQQINAETAQQPSTVSWEEAIKTVDKKAIAQKIGISDFALEMDEHIRNGGNAIDYLMARAVDYNKVSDLDIVKDNFTKKYPNLSSEERDALFADVYRQSEFEEENAKTMGIIRMKADAHELRQKKIAEQQSFKIPEPVKQEQGQQQPNNEAAIQQTRDFIKNHDATKSLIESKRVAIALGKEDSFRFNIDNPDFLIDVMTNKDTWAKVLSTKQGEPDMNRIIRAAKYIIDMDAHDNAIFNYGVQKGERKKVEGNQYVGKPVTKTGMPNQETLGKAFQTRAKVSTYGS